MSIKIKAITSSTEHCEACDSTQRLYVIEGHILCSKCIKEINALGIMDIGIIFDSALVH